jgi:putative nucleotidyltransferase with HDIG domain
VDAAQVLFLDAVSGTFAVGAARGFRPGRAFESGIPLDGSPAGWAVAEGGAVHAGLGELPEGRSLPPGAGGENFRGYHAVPLAAKGHLFGVLEVFERRETTRGPGWYEFLETIAGQLAIAIDSRRLLEKLARTNEELEAAYDVTLAGWSRALELRDRETRGHSERVVDLAVRLAREMGMPAAQIVHVKRGALLHDIGKMGIPDQILLKPGPLTEEEWGVMRQHPKLALELLSPIEFLAPALDIPYGHHERWDGTGYPTGLAGEAIPLAARVFAVADAWDALRVERPYREVWSAEKVKSYLRQEAGARFDPAVVEVFLGMLERPEPSPRP